MTVVVNGNGAIHPNELDSFPLFDCRSHFFNAQGGGDYHAFYFHRGMQILALMPVDGLKGDLYHATPSHLYHVDEDATIDLSKDAIAAFQRLWDRGTVQELCESGILHGNACQLK
ncbi:hypothetical protein BHAP_0708 [Bifidobacterium hapali]|uniref:Uncharacterized protein n=1 Tax=Bifidobacterium hapali TaxID=1630172 RepID=A0A261G191_9BIFI|nr:hypothetical protein [Bifidobacterium hapali]OZG65204.1 hypothetical protein BHAP_0708 [Bifidobacterium hapali]